MPVKPIPDGCRVVTPYLCVRNSGAAIEFYKKAFGAQEISRAAMPGGTAIMHAEIKIGDSLIFMSDEFPGMNCKSPETVGASTGSLHLYVQDTDEAFQRAVAAGAKPLMP